MNQRPFFRVFILGGVCVSACIGSAQAFDANDFQIRKQIAMKGKIAEKISVSLYEEFRFADNASDFYYIESDVGVTYPFLPVLAGAVHYRQLFTEKNGGWVAEQRPHLNLMFYHSRDELKLELRDRIELRFCGSDELKVRNRTRLKASYPVEIAAITLKTYVADEIFYDFKKEALNRNRVYIGASFPWTDKIGGDWYYLLESNEKDDEWKNYHILGIKTYVKY